MFQTIRVSSCVSIQGEYVESLANGDVLIRDGRKLYRGQPIRKGEQTFRPGMILAESALTEAV